MPCYVRNGLHRIPGIWWSFGVEADGEVGEAGIYHRYFLTKKAYYEMVELQNRGILRFQRLALVLEGTLHYLPVQTFFRDRE